MAAPDRPAPGEISVQLLGGFSLRLDGLPQILSDAAQRIVALLALRGMPLRRDYLAYTLWMDKPETRARANLRSALWRMRLDGLPIPIAAGDVLLLPGDVVIDYSLAHEAASAIVNGTHGDPLGAWPLVLDSDLLPDWYDDWVIMERERFRQARLHALEVLSHGLAEAGMVGRAIDLSLAVLASEPLRESAVRILVQAHLAEGNTGEAREAYLAYARRLEDELGVKPSPQLTGMVAASLPAVHPPRAVSAR